MIIDFPETYEKVGPALVRTGEWDPKKTFITDGLASSDLPEERGPRGDRGHARHRSGLARQRRGRRRRSTSCTRTRRGPERQTFDAQNFDAVILCYLAAVAAGSTDGAGHGGRAAGRHRAARRQVHLGAAAATRSRRSQNGDDIDYEGASGPIDLDEDGDPTAGVYDLVRFRDGKLDDLRRDAGRGAAGLSRRATASRAKTAGARAPAVSVWARSSLGLLRAAPPPPR